MLALTAPIPYAAAIPAVSSAGRSSPGAPSTPSRLENHFKIAYSLLRTTRKVTGTS